MWRRRGARMVRVGIIQTRSCSSNGRGIAAASRRVEALAGEGADIICLPEQWLRDNRVDDFDREFSAFRQIAKSYRTTVIPGAFYHGRGGGAGAVTAPVIGPGGEIVGSQDKIHPFGRERGRVAPGRTSRIFRTACRFGVLVCYDMAFPEVARGMAEGGAEILVSPSRIVKAGIAPWHMYVQVRSLENRIPIAAANVGGGRFGGRGMIAGLSGGGRGGIMVPKVVTTSAGNDAVAATFDVPWYRRHRDDRFSD